MRRNWTEYQRHAHDATIDHIVPKAKGGKNNRSNYALACRGCNTAKADRSVEEFLQKSPRIRQARMLDVRPDYVRPAKKQKAAKGTLARAIDGKQVSLPRGATLPPDNAPVPVYVHSAGRPPRRITALEVARFLREQALSRGQPWPLA